MNEYIWFDGMGTIELTLPEHVVDAVAQSGDNLPAILEHWPDVESELNEIDPDDAVSILEEYGAWEADELANHNDNLQRILWVACWDVAEQPDLYAPETQGNAI